MKWGYDALWEKARLFVSRAMAHPREDPQFPFWCSLGLEILARASLAKVHPALLADQKDNRHLLYAFGVVKDAEFRAKSISVDEVFLRCQAVVAEFTAEHVKDCQKLAGARNEELHSGGLPFEGLPHGWLPAFYGVCVLLLRQQGKTLVDLFGQDEANAAQKVLDASKEEVLGEVKKAIAAAAAAFRALSEGDRETRDTAARIKGAVASHQGYHTAECPACGSVGLMRGEQISAQAPRLEDEKIVIRSAVLPTEFTCPACGLKFDGYARISAAGLGAQYTHTVRMNPLDYYLPELEGEEYDNE